MASVKTPGRRTKLFRDNLFALKLNKIQLCVHYDYKYANFMNANRRQVEENRYVTVFDLIEW